MNTSVKIPLVIVAAMSRDNQAIGYKNSLLWQVPADLKRFKSLTMGQPVIMGRNTFESILQILGKPLPNRLNIILTRDHNYQSPGAIICHNLKDAIALARQESPREIHIGGGAALYHEALPLTNRLYITWFDDAPVADSFFPEFLPDFSQTISHPPENFNGVTYQWIDYERSAASHLS